MKDYPQIPRSTGQTFQEFDAYVFDKLDGSNLRWEWSKKQGWHKFGTRTRLFDASDPMFGVAIAIFQETMSEGLTKMAKDNRWDRLIVFTEFLGVQSFAGWHDPIDTKTLHLIDLAPHRQGILGPKEYLDLIEPSGLPHAAFLGRQRWTRGYIERVWNGEVPCTLEGVVGKSGSRHGLIMAKAKTKAWIEKVKALKTPEEAEKIINS